MPCFNGIDLTIPCLEAIGKREVILVDNASTDGTADRVREKFPYVRILRNERNCGFAVAVNQALKTAKTRYVLVLNNDTKLVDGSLETLGRFMDETAEAGIVTPQLIHEDGRLQNSIANFPSLLELFVGKGILRLLFPRRFHSKRAKFNGPTVVESVVGAAMFVRRECAESIGPLDERFFMYLEETDWCLRARRAGWKVFLHPDARVVHYQGQASRHMAARKRIEYTRSLFAYFKKNHPVRYPLLRLLFPFKNLVDILFALFTFSRRRIAEKSATLAWQLRGCPAASGIRPE